MKGFTHYVTNVIITQFTKHFDCMLFAEAVARNIKDVTDETVTVQEAKKSGMILRSKRNSSISNQDIKNGIIDAMQELIGNDTNDFEVDIVEKFEFEFDPGQINVDFIDDTMDIKRKGKDIYIEIDI